MQALWQSVSSFPVGFNQLSCYVLGDFHCFSYGSPLRYQTGKVLGGSQVLTVFHPPY